MDVGSTEKGNIVKVLEVKSEPNLGEIVTVLYCTINDPSKRLVGFGKTKVLRQEVVRNFLENFGAYSKYSRKMMNN